MKTFRLHHTPKSAHQDTWAVSFSLPYIATEYARGGDGVWYVKTWLTAQQISKRLAILFDDQDELRVHELGREHASLKSALPWMPGRLEDEDPMDVGSGILNAPRVMWEALNAAAQSFVFSRPELATAATLRNSRAA